jgi:type II secretory pathway predicted ATPase ExeA
MHRIEPSPSRNAAFRLTPDLRFLFAYPAHEQAFAKLRKGIEAGNRLLLLTGCFGVGKTLLLRRLAAELAKAGISSSYAALPHLDLAGLLSGKADQGPQWEAADQRHVFRRPDHASCSSF